MLRHRQNYLFQVHAFKCSLLTENTECLRHYFYDILNGERSINPEKFTLRASALDLSLPFTTPVPRQAYPSRLASIGIKSAVKNSGRHIALQRFFLAMDRSTVATEVPVYLTTEETQNIFPEKGGLLGHIDFLQVFNDKVTVLDYKPGAIAEKRVHEQLLLYAIALSTRTGIHLKNIMCAWFDEKDYFQFPAMDVYKSLKKRICLHSKISNAL